MKARYYHWDGCCELWGQVPSLSKFFYFNIWVKAFGCTSLESGPLWSKKKKIFYTNSACHKDSCRLPLPIFLAHSSLVDNPCSNPSSTLCCYSCCQEPPSTTHWIRSPRKPLTNQDHPYCLYQSSPPWSKDIMLPLQCTPVSRSHGPRICDLT